MADRIRIKDIAKMANVSVGTVDRVLHGRGNVSEASKKRVDKALEELNYEPNMFASALASNKKYVFAGLLPQHNEGEYWSDIKEGIQDALKAFNDFNVTLALHYYDPYNYCSFEEESKKILQLEPDGVLLAPTTLQYTKPFTEQLTAMSIPYIYLDSNLTEEPALSFFGQNSHRSGYFAASMLQLLAGKDAQEVVIFRKINKGIVGSNQQERREIGFKDYMQQHCPNCKIWELDLEAKYNSQDHAMLDKFFAEHPHLKNGITFNSKAYIIGEYLDEKGKKDFNLIGYDLLARNVSCLKRGSISFLIAQQPHMQGYGGIQTLCNHLILKKEVPRVNYMPIDLLTKENIDFYYDRRN